ncbi:MAG: MarR family winged helix-turn-helix transcriptional regulator [Betaproteobacteria bacterium]
MASNRTAQPIPPPAARARKPVVTRARKERVPSPAEVAMRSPESAQYRRMLDVLTQFRIVVANLKKHYSDIEAVTGVSGTQMWALIAVAQQPGLTVGMLARELAIHPSTASNLLDRLNELGHISRAREGADQRVVSVYLTDAGQKIVDKAPQPAMGLLQNALLSLPQDRVAGLQAHLDELIHALGVKRTSAGTTPLSVLLHDDDAARKAGTNKTKQRR